MELFELHTSIVKNEIPRFMIFVGPEYAIINQYAAEIQKRIKLPVVNIDVATTILNDNHAISLVNPNKLYICRYDKTFISNENAWKNINSKLKDCYLILIYNELDKRGRFYKKFQDKIVPFDTQPDATLKAMIKPHLKNMLNDNNLKDLIEGCGHSFGRMLLELDKLNVYNKLHPELSADECFNKLYDEDVFSFDAIANVFQFVDLVLTKSKHIYSCFAELKALSTSNIQILSLLYTGFRTQLVVDSMSREDCTEAKTGIKQFTINQARHRSGKYTLKELADALQTVNEIERGIKNGIYEEATCIDMLLAKVL